MASLLPFFGWAILPNYATSFLQSVYYGITIRAGEPKPLPQTPRYERHRRRIFIFVITSYLLYTLYETFYQVQLAGDYYQALGVSPFANERAIKSRFRRLAAQYHPDKVGLDSGSDAYFLYLRQAQETLVDPVKRFAYDRFGTDMLGWGEQKTMRDFLMTSLVKSIVPQYIGGLVTMLVLNWLWWANWGRYWRFYTFAALLTLELGLITHPQAVFMPTAYLPVALQAWLPKNSFYLLPFQILTLARRASIMLHIFISQAAPPTAKVAGNGNGKDKISPQTVQQIRELIQLTRSTDMEATRMLQMGLAPFRGDRASISTLRRGMKEGLILGGVRSSPEVQRAVAQVVERRKAEGDSKRN
ncbi:Membrane associated DnaJ chaperone, putative [Penicillium digitatum]|uniref:Membrane associated DnaJ chaperone, putative n=3 Tax=Penicillium digitatum TaxID=36651 RepID=K9GV22_PEND2|nr:Membrane associated DnaJ chaperone, putative [Penicillium digitatum Pd1]EKV11439.1 Membrane associated DnaJ chaperone, putative [Penicillium digitatum Pd1]EKV16926.1 Membrane associated DnaJ chaperone, putative [Penicillium digitatum PHI26]QQK43801.1 Membrane associated DnaJ chaperone, putative [Penicillium digitatum]